MNNKQIPVLFDTDIGSDIDDAVCLGYLLRHPLCELLGITTVSGQPQVRAALADAVCTAAGKDGIPIHSGHELSLVDRGIVQPQVPQAAVLERFAHRPPEAFPPWTAVDFLRRQIRDRPHEITLIAVGPMTNVALLFNLDPGCARLLKRLVLMCGVFQSAPPGWWPAEWNARCDPHATKVVYGTEVPEHLSVGLDVTTQCTMPCEDAIAAFRAVGGPLAVVSAATEVWSHHARDVIFHDPLAAACVFKPELCQFARGQVSVELGSTRSAGITWFDACDSGPHRIANGVDSAAFFQEYFGVVVGSGKCIRS